MPLILEAHGGGFGVGLREVLAIVAAGVSEKWNKKADSANRRIAQRLSFTLHSENATAIMDRLSYSDSEETSDYKD